VAALVLWRAYRDAWCPLPLRVLAGGIALVLILWPLWAATRDYLFLFSILPGHWPWLAAASVLAGLGLAALAIAPRRRG